MTFLLMFSPYYAKYISTEVPGILALFSKYLLQKISCYYSNIYPLLIEFSSAYSRVLNIATTQTAVASYSWHSDA